MKSPQTGTDDTNMGVGQYLDTPDEKEINRLNQKLADVLRLASQDRKEVQDWERWAREVLEDFKIPFYNHKVGMRLGITQWMADKHFTIHDPSS